MVSRRYARLPSSCGRSCRSRAQLYGEDCGAPCKPALIERRYRERRCRLNARRDCGARVALNHAVELTHLGRKFLGGENCGLLDILDSRKQVSNAVEGLLQGTVVNPHKRAEIEADGALQLAFDFFGSSQHLALPFQERLHCGSAHFRAVEARIT